MKADKTTVERLLKTARGQIDGILGMVEDNRYCIDIINQVNATTSILKKASREILGAHIESCVRESLTEGDSEEKIDELLKTIDKMSK